jgi:hypothetical protein
MLMGKLGVSAQQAVASISEFYRRDGNIGQFVN